MGENNPETCYNVYKWYFAQVVTRGWELLPEVAHEVSKGTGAPPCEDRLRKWRLFSLDQRRLHGDLIAACQYLRRAHKEAVEGLFKRNWSNRTKSNGFKLKDGKFRLDTQRRDFTVRLMRTGTGWPEKLCMPHVAVFNVKLDGSLSNLV